MFIRPSFIDILEEWFEDHKNNPHDATEPSLQRVTKDKQDRIAHLPETYNIGSYSIWKRLCINNETPESLIKELKKSTNKYNISA